ncbi:MAG: drug/metabolite exporter YedA [Anaerolineae bacterium]|nr:drug/metabolite exporter YedA [Anaerolineae bacterium]
MSSLTHALRERSAHVHLPLPLPVIVALGSIYIIWGTTYLGIKIGLESFPPLMMAGGRFMFAGTALMVFLRARGNPMPTLAQWRLAAFFGFLLIALGNGGVTFAEQYVETSAAAMTSATVPLWATLWMRLRGVHPTRREWLGVMIGFVGIILLNLNGKLAAEPIGLVALLLAAFGTSFGAVSKGDAQTAPGLVGAAAEMMCAGVFLLTASAIRGEQITHMPSLSSTIAVIYLLIFGSFIGYGRFSYLIKHVKPTLATSHTYVNPLVAVLIGVTIAGESLGQFGLPAMICIIGGVVLIVTGRLAVSH